MILKYFASVPAIKTMKSISVRFKNLNMCSLAKYIINGTNAFFSS